MAAKRTLLEGGSVLSLDPKIGNHQQADVLIEGAKIAQVGPNLIAADAEVIDATNTVVMPGFVDGHRHLWEGILRNIGVDVALEGDVSYLAFILNTLAPVYRPEDAYTREVGAHITAHVGVGSFGRFDKVGEMARAGLLGPDTTYIHCTTLNHAEIQAIVDTGGTVTLAVPVKMMMGHGMPPTQRFLDRGLAPSLSVDVETNVPSDMFTQMPTVISLQHVLCFDQKFAGAETIPDQITSRDVLSWATMEGARANALDHTTGSLTPARKPT